MLGSGTLENTVIVGIQMAIVYSGAVFRPKRTARSRSAPAQMIVEGSGVVTVSMRVMIARDAYKNLLSTVTATDDDREPTP